MRICAYLNFKGNGQQAMTYYRGIFRVSPEDVTYSGVSPSSEFPVDRGSNPLIMHGELFIGKDQSLMFSDDTRPGKFHMGDAVSLTLVLDDEAEQRRIFDALADGGKVHTPLAKTFWSALFGSLTDRFGVTWNLNLREPAPGA